MEWCNKRTLQGRSNWRKVQSDQWKQQVNDEVMLIGAGLDRVLNGWWQEEMNWGSKHISKQEWTRIDVTISIMNGNQELKSDLRFKSWRNLWSTNNSKEFTIRKKGYFKVGEINSNSGQVELHKAALCNN